MTTQLVEDPRFIQGTPEWVSSRSQYIGASEMSIILGHNEHKTPYQLWQEKLGLRKPDEENYNMRRGKTLEPVALRYLEKKENIIIERQPVLIHPEYDFIRVSLDGISKCENYIVEVKCPKDTNSTTHFHASLGSACPLVHYCQVQMCLEVARYYYPDLKGAFYLSYIHDSPDESIICEVLYDEKFVKKALKEAVKFWELVKLGTPPLMQENEYENIELADNNVLWQDLAKEYAYWNSAKKEAIKKEAELSKKLKEMSRNRNVKGYGVMLYHSERQGVVDYSKIEELRHVNLDDYRKDSTVVSTIKIY